MDNSEILNAIDALKATLEHSLTTLGEDGDLTKDVAAVEDAHKIFEGAHNKLSGDIPR